MKLFETHNTVFDILAAYWGQCNFSPIKTYNSSAVLHFNFNYSLHWMEMDFLFTCIKTYEKKYQQQ